jgi:spore coat protein U-like protein
MKLTKLFLLLASISALVIGSASNVLAATATSTFKVQTTVKKNCTIGTVDITFPDYDPLTGAAVDTAAGAVTITCTQNATTTIGLNFGSNTPSGPATMSDGASHSLQYALYKDAPGGALWGNNGLGLFTPAAAPSKAPRTFPIYGRIDANQEAPAGTYTDTVTATVNF